MLDIFGQEWTLERLSHGANRGSNPLRDATLFNDLRAKAALPAVHGPDYRNLRLGFWRIEAGDRARQECRQVGLAGGACLFENCLKVSPRGMYADP